MSLGRTKLSDEIRNLKFQYVQQDASRSLDTILENPNPAKKRAKPREYGPLVLALAEYKGKTTLTLGAIVAISRSLSGRTAWENIVESDILEGKCADLNEKSKLDLKHAWDFLLALKDASHDANSLQSFVQEYITAVLEFFNIPSSVLPHSLGVSKNGPSRQDVSQFAAPPDPFERQKPELSAPQSSLSKARLDASEQGASRTTPADESRPPKRPRRDSHQDWNEAEADSRHIERQRAPVPVATASPPPPTTAAQHSPDGRTEATSAFGMADAWVTTSRRNPPHASAAPHTGSTQVPVQHLPEATGLQQQGIPREGSVFEISSSPHSSFHATQPCFNQPQYPITSTRSQGSPEPAQRSTALPIETLISSPDPDPSHIQFAGMYDIHEKYLGIDSAPLWHSVGKQPLFRGVCSLAIPQDRRPVGRFPFVTIFCPWERADELVSSPFAKKPCDL